MQQFLLITIGKELEIRHFNTRVYSMVYARSMLCPIIERGLAKSPREHDKQTTYLNILRIFDVSGSCGARAVGLASSCAPSVLGVL